MIRKREANSALTRTSTDIKGIIELVFLLLQVLKRKKGGEGHKNKERCPLAKVLLLMPEGEGRHYPVQI